MKTLKIIVWTIAWVGLIVTGSVFSYYTYHARVTLRNAKIAQAAFHSKLIQVTEKEVELIDREDKLKLALNEQGCALVLSYLFTEDIESIGVDFSRGVCDVRINGYAYTLNTVTKQIMAYGADACVRMPGSRLK